jgi:hypothetical protein
MSSLNWMSVSQLARLQAAYYGVTGIWPLVDIEGFERITGPKVDRWLVKTVGAVVTAIGVSLAIAARDDPSQAQTLALATGSAAALGAIDFVYVAKRRISPVYLLDGVAQGALIAAWVGTRRARG